MRNILISVKPEYAYHLVNGIKTVEFRKVFPLSFNQLDMLHDVRMFIYCSQTTKKVIGEVRIKKVVVLPVVELWNTYKGRGMIAEPDFKEYFKFVSHGRAIEVYKAKPYEVYLPLSDFGLRRPPQSYQYIDTNE